MGHRSDGMLIAQRFHADVERLEVIVHRHVILALLAVDGTYFIIHQRHKFGILAQLVDGMAQGALEIAERRGIIGKVITGKLSRVGKPGDIGGIEQDTLGKVIGSRVVVVLQLELLKEMVTVLADVLLGSPGACLALFQLLLALGNLGSLGGLNRLGLVDGGNAVLDVTLGTQQRVRLGKASLQDAVTDAGIELIHEVIVDLGIALSHLADEFFVGLLLGIELLERLLILLAGDFVLLLEVLNLILTLLQLALQGAANLAFRCQFVVGLLFGSLEHQNQRIGGIDILFGQHLGVGHDISLLLHALDIEPVGGNREREHAVGLRDHGIGTLDHDSRTGDALARHNGAVGALASLGLDISLLGLCRRTQRQHHAEC